MDGDKGQRVLSIFEVSFAAAAGRRVAVHADDMQAVVDHIDAEGGRDLVPALFRALVKERFEKHVELQKHFVATADNPHPPMVLVALDADPVIELFAKFRALSKAPPVAPAPPKPSKDQTRSKGDKD